MRYSPNLPTRLSTASAVAAPIQRQGPVAGSTLQQIISASPRIAAQLKSAQALCVRPKPTAAAQLVSTGERIAPAGTPPIQRNKYLPGQEPKTRQKTRQKTRKNEQFAAKINKDNILGSKRKRRGVNRYGRGDGTRYGVGSYATYTGIRTKNVNRAFSPAERRGVNRLGATHGCHTCGTKISGWDSGNWTPDHQPPLSLSNLATYRGALYPHCQACSSRQGGVLGAMAHAAH